MKDILDRIFLISEKENVRITSLEKKIGASKGVLSRAIAKKTDIQSKWIQAIVENYPQYSAEWLLTGQGEMLKKEPDNLEKLRIEEVSSLSGGVPYYENVEGTCGIVSQFNDYKETPTFYINYEHFNDCNAYIPVVGDSMYPQYCSGEIIAVKRIYNMDIIQWGEAYFVVTNDNANSLRTVKLLHPHEDADKIILRASNPNFKGDTVINKADIVSLFIIKGKIKRNQL